MDNNLDQGSWTAELVIPLNPKKKTRYRIISGDKVIVNLPKNTIENERENEALVGLFLASRDTLQALEMALTHINIFTPKKHENPELKELILNAIKKTKAI